MVILLETPVALNAWPPLATALGELHDSHDALGGLAEQVFDELEQRRQELELHENRLRRDCQQLAEKAGQLARERRELEDSGAADSSACDALRIDELSASLASSTQRLEAALAELHSTQGAVDALTRQYEQSRLELLAVTHALDEYKTSSACHQAELAAARSELTAMTVQISQQCAAIATSAETEIQLHKQLHELQLLQQRAALELEQARAVRDVDGTQTAELAEACAQLAVAQAELVTLRRQAAAAPASTDALRRELDESHLERRGLEMELENIRERASELTENLSAQKRQAAEDRAHWSGELKELRRLLEKQAEQGVSRDAATHSVAATVRPETRGGAPASDAAKALKSDDPVLGSVMAQFETLQKDRLRRKATSR